MSYWKDETLAPAFEYMRLLTQHHSKSFYFSTRLLPAKKRWPVFALYGFCRFADNLIDNPRKRTTAQLKNELNCFKHELDLAYESGDSEHPIIKPFIYIAQKYDIPREYPFDLLRGVQMDIDISRYETFEDLYLFCYRVAAVVGLMMTHVMGYSDDSAFVYAEKLGIAMQLSNILRDIQEDKNMGRIYLPLSELRDYGLSDKDILDEKFNKRMRSFMQFQVERAHRYYEESNTGIPMLDIESRFAVSSAGRIYRGILYKIEKNGYNPFLGRVYVSFSKKITLLIEELLRTRTAHLRHRIKLRFS